MHDWDQSALIWSAICNTVRDAKQTPKPILPSVVHPLRTDSDYKPKPRTEGFRELRKLFQKDPE